MAPFYNIKALEYYRRLAIFPLRDILKKEKKINDVIQPRNESSIAIGMGRTW